MMMMIMGHGEVRDEEYTRPPANNNHKRGAMKHARLDKTSLSGSPSFWCTLDHLQSNNPMRSGGSESVLRVTTGLEPLSGN